MSKDKKKVILSSLLKKTFKESRKAGFCYFYPCEYCGETIRLSWKYKTCPNCGAPVPLCKMAKPNGNS